MDLASVVAALASVGVRVSRSTPNSNVQGDSSRACPTGLAGPEPSGTINDPGQHLYNCGQENEGKPLVLRRLDGEDGTEHWLEPQDVFDCFVGETEHQVWWELTHCRNYSESDSELEQEGTGYSECELEEDFSEEIDDNSENKESSEHEPEESFSGGADDPAESKENRSYGSELSSPLQDVGPLESPDAFSFTAPVPVTAHSLSVTAHSQSRWCRYGTRCWRHKKGQCHFRHK